MHDNIRHRSYRRAQEPAPLELRAESMGKTQVRQELLPLVKSMETHPRTIEIMDRDRPVAVLMPYQHYVAVTAQFVKLNKKAKTKPNLMGSVTIVSDLKSASKRIGEKITQEVKRSAGNL